MTQLSTKRQMFVDLYDGNAAATAKLVGYAYPSVEGNRLFNDPAVIAALDERDHNKHKNNIASREERQAFWTTVMRNDNVAMGDRLKAADSLGRSEADFVDRMKLEIGLGEELKKLSDDDIRNKIKMLEDSGVIEMIRGNAENPDAFESEDLN